MKIKALITSTVLAAAMCAGPAFAVTFNGVEVPEDELPYLQQQCEKLINSQETAGATTDKSTETGAQTAMSNEPDGTAKALTPTIDLDTVTIEQCKAAGLGE